MFFEVWKRVIANVLFSVIAVTTFTALSAFAIAFLSREQAVLVTVVMAVLMIGVSALVAKIRMKSVDALKLADKLILKGHASYAEKILRKFVKEAFGETRDDAKYRLARLEVKKRENELARTLLEQIDKDQYEWGWQVYESLALIEMIVSQKSNSSNAAQLYEASFRHRRKFDIPYDNHDVKLCRLVREKTEHDGDKDRAYIWFHKEMAVKELMLKTAERETFENYVTDGDRYRSEHEPDLALSEYEKALSLIAEKLSDENFEYALVSEKCAATYLEDYVQPQITKAASHLQTALNIRKIYLGNKKVSDYRSDCFYPFLNDYRTRSLATIAFEMFTEGYSSYEHLPATVLMSSSNPLTDLLGEQAKALIPLVSDIWGNKSLELIKLHYMAGTIFKWRRSKLDDFENAAQHYQESVRIFRQCHNPNDAIKRIIVQTMIDYGGVYLMNGKNQDALVWRLKAFKLAQNIAYEPGVPPTKPGIQLRAEMVLYETVSAIVEQKGINAMAYDEGKAFLAKMDLVGEIKHIDKHSLSSNQLFSQLKITTTDCREFIINING